eukprot:1144144-Pelagomonas_calceolata.AAC.1
MIESCDVVLIAMTACRHWRRAKKLIHSPCKEADILFVKRLVCFFSPAGTRVELERTPSRIDIVIPPKVGPGFLLSCLSHLNNSHTVHVLCTCQWLERKGEDCIALPAYKVNLAVHFCTWLERKGEDCIALPAYK